MMRLVGRLEKGYRRRKNIKLKEDLIRWYERAIDYAIIAYEMWNEPMIGSFDDSFFAFSAARAVESRDYCLQQFKKLYDKLRDLGSVVSDDELKQIVKKRSEKNPCVKVYTKRLPFFEIAKV